MRLHPNWTLSFSIMLLGACSGPDVDVPTGAPGDPLPNLSAVELARFERGRGWFDHAWTPEEGLGPLYLQERCSSCHDLPVLGGTGTETLPLMTRFDPETGCDPLVQEGGPVRQERATSLAQAHGVFREEVAPSATERVTEMAPMLFGLGLVEAIPDEVIEGWADPDDLNGDGISGRVARTEDGRLGRFTRKGEVASVLEQSARAFSTDIGITSLYHPEEQTLNGDPLPPETDPALDPELDPEILSLIADYVRFLAPPAREEPVNAATGDSIAAGASLFSSVGCTNCHVPALETGPHEIAALSEKTIFLYSDLLLHDLGPDYRGVCGVSASPTEFRTRRLMGLRIRTRYEEVQRAYIGTILAHGGEAQEAREAFEGLNSEGKNLLLRFLMSL